MKTVKINLVAGLLFLAGSVFAQTEGHHEMHGQKDSTEAEGMQHDMHAMDEGGMMMPKDGPSISRRGSGTGWLPDAAPRYGYMMHSADWMYMIHGNVFLRYTNMDIGNEGTRGDEKFGSTNWIMGMGQTKVGENGLFSFSAMLSLEALSIGGAGYPLLFQTGETWEGEPLVDHQHPHDLFSELSVSYKQAFSEDLSAFVYLGYPGEPALGPVAFMHRPSGIYNSNTPLGHHWTDATHVTFGVATLGFQINNLKLEGSIFTGTEPNEDRYGFDEPRFNSQSLRLSYNPSPNWALQVSHGWLNDVHAIGQREDMNRTTASAIHALQFGQDSFLNTSAVWGYNNTTRGHHPSSHSFLLESALTLNNSSIYGRYEWVEKSGGSLLLDEAVYPHDELYGINAFTLGFQQKLFNAWDTNFSLGVQGKLHITPDDIVDVYGENPIGLQAYIRIYPGMMMH